MKTHYSAVELAEMMLPGLPTTDRNIRQIAERAGWDYVSEPSRGRTGTRREYAVTSLPADARQALLDRAVAVVPLSPSPVPATGLTTGAVTPPAVPVAFFAEADLTDKQRAERDARTGVIAAIRALQVDTGCTQDAAMTTILTNARAGRLEPHLDRTLRMSLDPRGRSGDGYPSMRTLKRWLAAGDLVPRAKRADFEVPLWAQTFLREYQRPEKPSVKAAYDAARRQWDGEPFSVHQARRFLGRLGTVTRERGRMGERELKNIRPFVRRTFADLCPNDVWSADGHTFDAEVQHPLHGRPFRPEITTFVDIATRRVVGWSVDLAESATAVADGLRYSVERHGIPAILYVDNGGGYKNAYMHGGAARVAAECEGDAAVGLMGRLGIQLEHSIPYNSQARGVIERLHQTLWVAGAKDLPGFMGREMDREARLEQFKLSRKALKNGGAMPLMPWHLFLRWVGERVDWYNARQHRTLRGLTPDMAWRDHEARGWAATLPQAEDVDTLFRPRVVRVLQRAEIRLFNNIYFARELEEFHGLEAHIAYDIHDASKVWVYTPEGRLICTADVNGNAKHYFPVPVVEQARQRRAQGRLKRTDAKREEILAELHGAAALDAPQAGQVVIGGRVLDAEATLAARREAITLEGEARAVTEAATPAKTAAQVTHAPVSRSALTAEENYADWEEIGCRIAAGEEVSDAEQRWHRSYPNSAQYKAHVKKMTTSGATRVA